MALPQIPNAFRTYSRFSNVPGGRPWSVVLDYTNEDALGSAANLAATLVGQWVAFFTDIITGTDSVEDYFHSSVKLQEVIVYDLGNTSAPAVESGFVTPPGGVSTQQPLPPDIAMVVSKRTEVRGRSGRGRTYLGGLVTFGMAAGTGQFRSSIAGGMQAAYAANLVSFSDLTPAQYDLGVISQATNPSGELRKVANVLVDVNADVQRRRGQG